MQRVQVFCRLRNYSLEIIPFENMCGKQKWTNYWMTSSQPFCFQVGSGRSMLFKTQVCLVCFRNLQWWWFHVLPRHSRKSSESSATWKIEDEQGKVFLPATKTLEKWKSPEWAINDPSGTLAAGSHLKLSMVCVDELQVLPSHKSVKFPFALIFIGSHYNISNVYSSLLHCSLGR